MKRHKIWEAVETDRAFRKEYFLHDFYAFAIYYFGQNFITGIKDFHKELYGFLNTDKNGVIIGFRESAKTTIIALIYIVYCIAYSKEKFILFMAYDIESASDKVLNVSNFLRSNKKFKNDYGNLFRDKNTKDTDSFNAQKTINKFVSTTGVKVEAVSLKNMKRGKQLLNEDGEVLRPSLLIADDIDIDESVRNKRIIDENYSKITGATLKSLRGRIIFLGNIIAEDGIIPRLEENFKIHWYTKRIALIEDGEIVWPERYVWTQKEANEKNKELYNGEKIVQSIEELSIDKETFNSDFLNIPKMIIGDPVFDIENLQKLEILDPYHTYNITIDDRTVTLEIFKEDFRKNYYDYLYAGVDTGGGQGGDSDSTDLCFLDKNGKLYAKVNSNILNYKNTARLLHILCSQFGFVFNSNCLCIERNYLGIALIDELVEKYPDIALQMYVPNTEGKKITKYTNIFGWNTTYTSKEKMKEDLSAAINNQKISFSKEEYKEFKGWTKSDKNGKIVYEPNGINTKHDDRIIGRGLAFQMFLKNNPNYL